MRTRRALGLSLALVVPLLWGGCKKEADRSGGGQRFACSCDFLTDMDDASVTKVEVCAEDVGLARERAIGCAQSGAPATVQGCRCEPAKGPGCPPGDCEVAERR